MAVNQNILRNIAAELKKKMSSKMIINFRFKFLEKVIIAIKIDIFKY